MRPPDWTPKEIDRLREFAAEGLSSEAIGRRLGKTKNSIIGQARRRGIALTYRQYDRKPPPGRKYWRTVLDLEPDLCKFPEGDDHFTFCGAPQVAGYPYCSEHAALCLNRPA